ncbi:carbonic anhydrase [Enterococcus ureasiticus]|uniref:Carbonic anhydrase n=1 Tax=Enterococcus ureasiticus TaxID=903984 RepID=A0A1E5GM58_9ENTE|nr:carbonic anhydrase family protein [Enterococcus ureasiticus]OEG13772.1 carbonic anhydrase [Enterococcus ureasiticus]
MKRKLLISLLFSSLLLVTACTQQVQSKTGESSSHTQESSRKKEASHFEYDDQKSWKQVSGKMQSPIDIPDSSVEKMEDGGSIKLDYSSEITNAENNGHSIQVNDSGKATINQRTFALTQFHFHAESEHTVNGKHYPLEAHFVNESQDGRLAVIGVFFIEGADNKGFQEVLDDVSDDKKTAISDIKSMFPENMSYYHYLGSLTTPPLTENVEWYILKNPVEVSKKQINMFQEYYEHNNRNIQSLNDRVILEHDE